MENWKDIKGFEGLYQISDYGNVKSLKRLRDKKRPGILKERILKPRYDKRGYIQYILYKNGLKTSVKGHHLVWDHFGDGKKRQGRLINIDHIDGNKSNNNILNLQTLSNRENLAKGKLKYNKSSRYTGVYKPKGSEKFQAYITVNKKHKYLGSFVNEYDAHLAYQKAANESD